MSENSLAHKVANYCNNELGAEVIDDDEDSPVYRLENEDTDTSFLIYVEYSTDRIIIESGAGEERYDFENLEDFSKIKNILV